MYPVCSSGCQDHVLAWMMRNFLPDCRSWNRLFLSHHSLLRSMLRLSGVHAGTQGLIQVYCFLFSRLQEKPQLFDKLDLLPLDPTQELIFPPELIVSHQREQEEGL